jgi:hypothetical protein
MASAVVYTDVVSLLLNRDTPAEHKRPQLVGQQFVISLITFQRADAWIAATALFHDIPLITHNRDDYLGIDGLTVLSEAP